MASLNSFKQEKPATPRYEYQDARGIMHKGWMEQYVDHGGSDHTAFMRDQETNELSLVSGSRLKQMKNIYK